MNSVTEDRLIDFIREKFLAGDPDGELTAESPLLQWGILDSLKVAILLTFIREQLGVIVPFQHLSAKNFGTVRSMAVLVTELGEPAPDHADSVHSIPPS
ncbi:acyl carrier protein [Amycolatopsis sp. CA-230715]|uniref:acyl carrier protein n=1 Tax=Amycolatopsis sp. CA-230715 TaxID=2745196 RepID=UPI001C01C242|nr:phosphopantetheine-binding protein [Amycolatopsis sp. CA-230715]QWF82458.1 hypothetical protein HUW46_05895 [Amycolatopsis sp. CA-230715]